jgi:rRNA maturation protein Nop10
MSVTDTNDCDAGGVRVTCKHCGYEWIYSGEMWKATCPNCGRKTKTPHDPDYDAGAG